MDYLLAILVIIGGGLGYLALLLTKHLIKQRTDSAKLTGFMFNGVLSHIIWIVVGILAGIGIWLLNVDVFKTIELTILFFVLLSLSAVDAKIRKIPNPLLLTIIVLKITLIIVGFIQGNGSFGQVLFVLAGAVLGWLAFALPARFGVPAGWGDVKLAAVTGFYLGIVGLVQAMLIMSILILIYGLMLIITKKGNLKTAVAYGPALSIGIFTTAILPIIEILINQ